MACSAKDLQERNIVKLAIVDRDKDSEAVPSRPTVKKREG